MVSSCSLLVDRFELEDPKGQDGNQPVPILKLKEHRRTNGEGSVHHPEPTGALNFITDVANGDFEVFWDEDPAGKGWKTWKVTATRVTSALLVHYCVQRRPAGIYLQSGEVRLHLRGYFVQTIQSIICLLGNSLPLNVDSTGFIVLGSTIGRALFKVHWFHL